jgi:hypothetical protein
MSGSGKRFHLQLHQALGGEADHLAQQVASELFSKSVRRFMISSVIGGSSNQVGIAIRPYRRIIDDRPQAARSLQRYGLRARSRLAPPCYSTTGDPALPPSKAAEPPLRRPCSRRIDDIYEICAAWDQTQAVNSI